LEGSDVDTAGSVHFRKAPGDRGTEVRVVMKYDPPGGRAADRIASLFGASPEQYVEEDLRRFKSVMETGTFPRTEGQPRGGGRR
ncbi:MAG TPA: cyclase, partial [Gemmataceae bacterium]